MKKQVAKLYSFTLVLKNIDEKTNNLEDSLYEAGCDDALINCRAGTVYLDFDREAPSLEHAVLSAIHQVESAPIGAIVSHVAPEDWVTESDVARRLEIERQAVSLWVKGKRRKSFPKPIMRLAVKSPLWKWREIAEWLFQNQLVKEEELLINATFLENVNAVLEERNVETRRYRQGLLKKLTIKPEIN